MEEQPQYPTGVENSSRRTGGHVFAIPTNGAITCRLQLYGFAVTIADCAWARIALTSPPTQSVVSTQTQTFSANRENITLRAAGYSSGELMGTRRRIEPLSDTGIESKTLIVLRDVRVSTDWNTTPPAPPVLPDFDLLIGDPDYLEGADGAVFDGTTFGVWAWLEFRAAPGVGQYKLLANSAPVSFAAANNLNLLLPLPFSDDNIVAMRMIARGTFATAAGTTFVNFDMTFDWG